ncbi:hypothetical protein [Flavobacterium sp.]|uniref:hypothetical protein n=1 Tax=Flavobacterium sp. TaxID=239 RepID=UPI003342DC00
MKKMIFSAFALVAFTASSMAGEKLERLSESTEKNEKTVGICQVTVTLYDREGNVISSQNYIDFNSSSEFACQFFALKMRSKFLSSL